MPIEIKELIVTGKVAEAQESEVDVVALIDKSLQENPQGLSVIEKNKIVTECVEKVLIEIRKQSYY